MASCGGTSSPRRFRSSSRSRQSCALSRAPSVKPTSSLAAFRRRANQHQDALLFVFKACLDAIGPDVDVALCRQIAPLPRGVFVKPTVLQAADGGCRQPGSILAEQRCQSLGEVAGNTLQVKDRRAASRSISSGACRAAGSTDNLDPAVGVGSVRLAIAYTRLLADAHLLDAERVITSRFGR